MIANSSLLQMGQLSQSLASFFKKNIIRQSFLQSSRYLSCPLTTQSNALVSTLNSLYKSSNKSIGFAIIRLQIFLNAHSCSFVYQNSMSFFIKLYKGFAMLLKFLMNIQQKLANLINPQTSIILVSIDYVLIALTLVSSMRICPNEISKPRKTIFVIQNSLLSLLIKSFYTQSASSTCFTCFLYSSSVLEKIRILFKQQTTNLSRNNQII